MNKCKKIMYKIKQIKECLKLSEIKILMELTISLYCQG